MKHTVKDPNRLERLLTQYENTVYRTALAILGNVQDAEDAAQDTFLTWLEKAPDFPDESHEKAWLLRVAVNRSRTGLRYSRRHSAVPLWEELPTAGPEERQALEEVFSLTPKERVAVHLYYYEGYRTAEIAAITGEAEGTIRSRLSRARNALRIALEGD